jgi:DNA-binding Lrp family transcriptional regulator
MSVNAIYKRIKSMVELGIIQEFYSRLGIVNFPNMANVLAFGVSKSKNPKEIFEKLGVHECIYNVTQASSNLFYILAYIRNLSQLEPLINFIRENGEIDELNIGILSQSYPVENLHLTSTSLSDIDYLIINALKDNSRKTVIDIAEEIGSSSKTVKRHLDLLVEKNLIYFTINWYPDKTSEFISYITLKVNPENRLDVQKIMEELRSKYAQKVLFSWTFINLPDVLFLCIWITTMKELQNIESYLRTKEFKSVNVSVLIEGRNYPTWCDSFLEAKVKEIKEKNR